MAQILRNTARAGFLQHSHVLGNHFYKKSSYSTIGKGNPEIYASFGNEVENMESELREAKGRLSELQEASRKLTELLNLHQKTTTGLRIVQANVDKLAINARIQSQLIGSELDGIKATTKGARTGTSGEIGLPNGK